MYIVIIVISINNSSNVRQLQEACNASKTSCCHQSAVKNYDKPIKIDIIFVPRLSRNVLVRVPYTMKCRIFNSGGGGLFPLTTFMLVKTYLKHYHQLYATRQFTSIMWIISGSARKKACNRSKHALPKSTYRICEQNVWYKIHLYVKIYTNFLADNTEDHQTCY